MKKLIIITLSVVFCACNSNGQHKHNSFDKYATLYMHEQDTIGKKFQIVGIPFDTVVYYGSYSDKIIDITGDNLKDAIGRVELTLNAWNSNKYKNDTNLNQLCIYINEGDSIFRYKTRSPFVLSDYYMGWYKILPHGNDGFCIKTIGQQLDWNKYYLYFKYDKPTDKFYLVRSLVQAEYEDDTKTILKVEEKMYDTQTRIPFEKVDFDEYFKHLLEVIPEREEWTMIKVEKSILYDNNFLPTKSYLIKNDEVRLDKEEDDFYKITYMTNKGKIIEGYIKKTDVD